MSPPRNGAGTATAWSALTDVVVGAAAPAPAPPTPQAGATAPSLGTAPAVSGTPQQGQTLTASTGTWNGTAPMTYAYQWFYCDQTGGNCAPIVGYTQSTYKPVVYDVGGRNKVRVTATNGAGSAQAYSALTAVVTAAPEATRPVNTTSPDDRGHAAGRQEPLGERRHVDGRPADRLQVPVAPLRLWHVHRDQRRDVDVVRPGHRATSARRSRST